MAYTIVFRQKYGFSVFLLSFSIPCTPISLRCEMFRKLPWPLWDSSYGMSNESSRLDLSEKILLQTSESLESYSLLWLHSKKSSSRPWRKLGIKTDERKPVFTSLAEVILDAILFIFLRATSSRKSSWQYARAPRGMTRFVLKIEILSHIMGIMGTRPDLALTVSSHYGSWFIALQQQQQHTLSPELD